MARAPAMDPGELIQLASCTVDLARRRVVTPTGQVALGRLEAQLLRYLAQRSGTDVPRDELLREVWGPDVDAGSRAVDFAVKRLREKLGEPDPPRHLLTSHGVGYRFVGASTPAGADPPPAQRRPRIRIVAGVIDLDERWVEVAGRRVDLTRTDGELLLRLADRLGEPVPNEVLIRELWGRGQHQRSLSAALARLRRKLEVDPSDPRVVSTVRNVGTRLVGVWEGRGQRTNLEEAVSPFVDRSEAEALRALAGRERLITLVGPAGVGKTRLAREVALGMLRDAALEEAWFCDLASVFDRSGVEAALARALGILAADAVDRAEQVAAALASRSTGSSVLVILDNFEHLLPAADLVARWSAAAPACRLWVTSRGALALPGEALFPVGALDEDAAVALFEARSGGADIVRTDVRALVRRLDRLPLAIELAAARSAQLPPRVMLERIEERLELLVRAPDALVSHHSTLRGAIDWSWDLLGPTERSGLAALSVLVAPFDARVATALLGPDGVSVVERLVAGSLLQEGDDGCWRMLESIRAYAAEKLTLSGQRDDALARRAAWFLADAERWTPALNGPDGGRALQAVLGARDELIAIHRHAVDPDVAARAALALARAEQRAGPTVCGDLLAAALDRGPSRALALQLRLEILSLDVLFGEADPATLAPLSGLARTEREHALVARAQAMTASARRAPEASEQLLAARNALLAVGEGALAARILGAHGWLGDLPLGEREAVLVQAVAEVEAADDRAGRAVLLHHLAEVQLHEGAFDQAEATLEAGLAETARTGDWRVEMRLRHAAAVLRAERGLLREASAMLLDLEHQCLRAGFKSQADLLRWERGAIALDAGDAGLAVELLSAPSPARSSATVNLAVALLVLGRWGAGAAVLAPMGLAVRPGRIDFFADVYRAVGLAAAGDAEGASILLEGATAARDPAMYGVDRFLALCGAAVAVCADPEAAHLARAVLDAGVLVEADDGSRIERPQDLNFARMLLVRCLDLRGPGREGQSTV